MHILFLEDYRTPWDSYGVGNALLDEHLLAPISMRNREWNGRILQNTWNTILILALRAFDLHGLMVKWFGIGDNSADGFEDIAQNQINITNSEFTLERWRQRRRQRASIPFHNEQSHCCWNYKTIFLSIDSIRAPKRFILMRFKWIERTRNSWLSTQLKCRDVTNSVVTTFHRNRYWATWNCNFARIYACGLRMPSILSADIDFNGLENQTHRSASKTQHHSKSMSRYTVCTPFEHSKFNVLYANEQWALTPSMNLDDPISLKQTHKGDFPMQ